jgi:hypothetical protein
MLLQLGPRIRETLLGIDAIPSFSQALLGKAQVEHRIIGAGKSKHQSLARRAHHEECRARRGVPPAAATTTVASSVPSPATSPAYRNRGPKERQLDRHSAAAEASAVSICVEGTVARVPAGRPAAALAPSVEVTGKHGVDRVAHATLLGSRARLNDSRARCCIDTAPRLRRVVAATFSRD